MKKKLTLAQELEAMRSINEHLIRERDQARLRFEEFTKEFEELKESLKSERDQADDALEALRVAETRTARLERVLKLVRGVVSLEFPPASGELMSAAVALAAGAALGLWLFGVRS